MGVLMRSRRQFLFGGLAAIAAGCATRLEPPMGVEVPWTTVAEGSPDRIWYGDSVPSLGNGELTIRYRVINGLYEFTCGLSIGSSTVSPTGTWTFLLPSGTPPFGSEGPEGHPLSSSKWVVPGLAYDDNLALGYPLVGRVSGAVGSARQSQVVLFATSGAAVSSTAPMTWATNDYLYFGNAVEAFDN